MHLHKYLVVKERLRGEGDCLCDSAWQALEVCVVASTLGLVDPGTFAQSTDCICFLLFWTIMTHTHNFVCSFVHWSICLGLFCALSFDIALKGGKPNTDKAISFLSKPQYTLTASPLRFLLLLLFFSLNQSYLFECHLLSWAFGQTFKKWLRWVYLIWKCVFHSSLERTTF